MLNSRSRTLAQAIALIIMIVVQSVFVFWVRLIIFTLLEILELMSQIMSHQCRSRSVLGGIKKRFIQCHGTVITSGDEELVLGDVEGPT